MDQLDLLSRLLGYGLRHPEMLNAYRQLARTYGDAFASMKGRGPGNYASCRSSRIGSGLVGVPAVVHATDREFSADALYGPHDRRVVPVKIGTRARETFRGPLPTNSATPSRASTYCACCSRSARFPPACWQASPIRSAEQFSRRRRRRHYDRVTPATPRWPLGQTKGRIDPPERCAEPDSPRARTQVGLAERGA